MSETDDLKLETQKQAMMQKMDSISQYLDMLIKKSSDTFYWSMRADALEFFSFSGYTAIAFACSLTHTSKDMTDLYLNLAWLVVLTAIFRGWNLNREWAKAEAEWKGAITILNLLGMVPPPPDRTRDKKKVGVWSEGIDMVKGWATKKQAAQEKVYAPA